MPLPAGLLVVKYPPLAPVDVVVLLFTPNTALLVALVVAEMVPRPPLPLSYTSRVLAGAVVPMPTLVLTQPFSTPQPLMLLGAAQHQGVALRYVGKSADGGGIDQGGSG